MQSTKHKVIKNDHFSYLGLIIHKEREIENDVVHWIKACWIEQRSVIGILCDLRVIARLKEKFYRTAIRPSMLYGTECWTVKKIRMHKMNVVKMRVKMDMW